MNANVNYCTFVNIFAPAYYAAMAEDKELKHIRDRIDEADLVIVDALSRRMKLVEDIGEYKKKHDLHITDAKRNEEILTTRPEWGRSRGLTGNFVREIFERILKYSKELQK